MKSLVAIVAVQSHDDTTVWCCYFTLNYADILSDEPISQTSIIMNQIKTDYFFYMFMKIDFNMSSRIVIHIC